MLTLSDGELSVNYFREGYVLAFGELGEFDDYGFM